MNNDTASTASLLDDTYMVPILKKNASGGNLLKVGVVTMTLLRIGKSITINLV